MNAKLPILLVAVSLLAGCGSAASGPAFDLSDPGSFKAGVEHPYFPMVPGTVWTYEGIRDGAHHREEVRVLIEPRLISGVPCMGLREELFVDGELAEVATEWLAEDRTGNLWKFGEEAIEFDGPHFGRTADSWVAGEGDAIPWMMLSATPSVGKQYVGYRPGGQDLMRVEALDASVLVAAGSFFNCLKILENPDDIQDQDIILYSAGVGRVQEASASGRIDLVSTRSE